MATFVVCWYPLQTVWIQIRPDKTWIQTIRLSDGTYSLRFFWVNLKKKNPKEKKTNKKQMTKQHEKKKYPASKDSRPMRTIKGRINHILSFFLRHRSVNISRTPITDRFGYCFGKLPGNDCQLLKSNDAQIFSRIQNYINQNQNCGTLNGHSSRADHSNLNTYASLLKWRVRTT